ncbi:MAG: 23S rRNA (adenine(2503)-C(2))-methyltransferase RlmN, partial [Chloroflexota bacterium]
MSAIKDTLLGKTRDELTQLSTELGLPSYTGGQLAYWLYKTAVDSFDEMTNISKKARALIAEKFDLGFTKPVSFKESLDGTKKYLFNAGNAR